ncbi:hypothetical protein CC86DRAFT_432582 [Ophiobolus disseminans]|uniref:Uncharacterized protein n=1 Tax=Ophiobolus disseminans TaxID=1469910 RepID=A0A6A6ZCL9_9PLEO|nr:hypothetical protein CC86DRAFT_432582 [Ophiobolus disseminans]
MDNLREKQISKATQQSRAKSAPIENEGKETIDIMGRGYRTPSPARDAYFISGNICRILNVCEVADSAIADVSPKSDLKTTGFETVGLPVTPRRTARFDFATPGGNQGLTNGYGLLTPSTPGFNDAFMQSPSLQRGLREREDSGYAGAQVLPYGDAYADDEPLLTHFERLQQQIRDAELAAQLVGEQNTTSTRRSTRLTRNDTAKVVDNEIVVEPIKSPKAVTQVPTAPPAPPPESSLTEEAIAQLPPDPNPAVLTLDWQLQYPPGGSTHPSYAYPQLDPRLLFNPSLVPVIDGLPSIYALPPLVLPMGWRHISWSGFLPIAFDPYHQAFKLTPIGPLPLTCEEVQQGGLAKFVPGGECHPEAGLLPDATYFSDGSDEERYNFDGVDWVLPWPQGEIFCGTQAMEVTRSTGDSSTEVKDVAVPGDTPLSFYFEGRDCPDNVVDLEDAWRWMKEKETNPTTAFVPSPTKTWHGTGIWRSARRFKSPIASLMGRAIRDTFEAPNDPLAPYLLAQNAREFCPFRSMAPPVNVNIALLGDVEFTLQELLSYFPSHYMWPKGANRLVRSGMIAGDITNMINMVRQLSGDAAKNSSTIRSSITNASAKASEGSNGSMSRDEQESEVHSYTAETWTHDNPDLVDYPILGLMHGLLELPQGVDAGPLTQLIVWCRETARYDVLLSAVPDVLQEAGISSLIEPGEGGCPDKEVLGRHVEALKKDRQRVLRIAKKKRAAEEGEEELSGKRKRVKTD